MELSYLLVYHITIPISEMGGMSKLIILTTRSMILARVFRLARQFSVSSFAATKRSPCQHARTRQATKQLGRYIKQ